MTKKILSALCCSSCGRPLSEDQELFDTAWSEIYWCGDEECAFDIMNSNCEQFDLDDDAVWEKEK